MKEIKQKVLNNVCYTELVYSRINKKLKIEFTKEQIEVFIHMILKETDDDLFLRTGKNIYVTNTENNIRITINSNTFRIITVDKIRKNGRPVNYNA